MKEIQVIIDRSEKGFSVRVKKDGGPLGARSPVNSDLGKAIQNALFADRILWLSGNFAMWKNESVKISFHMKPEEKRRPKIRAGYRPNLTR